MSKKLTDQEKLDRKIKREADKKRIAINENKARFLDMLLNLDKDCYVTSLLVDIGKHGLDVEIDVEKVLKEYPYIERGVINFNYKPVIKWDK